MAVWVIAVSDDGSPVVILQKSTRAGHSVGRHDRRLSPHPCVGGYVDGRT